MKKRFLSLLFWVVGGLLTSFALADSLPPLKDGKAPQNLDELWGDYDPRKESLDVEILRQWQEDGTTLRVIRYTIGTFKGEVSTMAAFYAFPDRAKSSKLPALIHLHGGGQRASLDMARYAADNGYAGLSINWGGKPMQDAPAGEANTDWGAIDATQKGHNSHYGAMTPDELTLDTVQSPRNNNWFLLVLAARRGLTFLEQQPEVDGDRLGVLGHSMGGKLTVNLAGIDNRVKAAAPSCGGCGTVTDSQSGMPGFVIKETSDWFNATIADNPYIDRITAPILYCSPTNDFAGPLDNMYYNWRKLPKERVRYSISPHLNHRHRDEFAITRMLWLEAQLKGEFRFPQTPKIAVSLSGDGGVPVVTVTPDASKPIERVDIFYAVDPHVLTRFWRDAEAKHDGEVWRGRCPNIAAGQPLFVFANVTYRLDHQVITVRGRASYEGPFTISSELRAFTVDQLQAGGVRFDGGQRLLIDDFARGWQDWYHINWGHPPLWYAVTRKLKDPSYQGTDGARLTLDVRSTEDNLLVIGVITNQWGAMGPGGSSEYLVERKMEASPGWQTMSASVEDFLPVQKGSKPPKRLMSWDRITELRIGAGGGTVVSEDGAETELGNQRWRGAREFRNLRWERPVKAGHPQ